jgi:hypothetical protein
MREIRTSVDIDATPEAVWSVLANFDAYSEWNPFIRSISGTLAKGEQLDVSIGASGKKPMSFTPVVTAVIPGEEFAWLGHLGMKGIFDGHHHFQLSVSGTGTRLDHFEEFSGVLSPIILASIGRTTTRGFEEMNQALKDRIEATIS